MIETRSLLMGRIPHLTISGQMMKVNRFDNATQYYQKVESYLLLSEAIHCLILGISKDLCRSQNDASQHLTVVENNKSIVATAIQAPPRKLILSQAIAKDAVEIIARDVANNFHLPGVIAPKIEAKAFIDSWQRLTGQSRRLNVAMSVHQLKTVQPVTKAAGKLRLAEERDRHLLTDWGQAFETEALGENTSKSDHKLWFDRHLKNQSLFVWQDNVTVSMAACSGATPNGIRINAVYTPPEYRGKGYATSCVAEVSRQLRDRYSYCFLFTNLADPVSNHIYRKIGYLPMAEINNYSFN